MNKITVQFEGDNAYPFTEEVKVRYGNKLIYDGYTDGLVTTSDYDNTLQLNLNYGIKGLLVPVIARYVSTMIMCIPNIRSIGPDEYNKYEPILFEKDDFRYLWESLRYNPESELENMLNISVEDIKSLWMFRCPLRDVYVDSVNEFCDEIITTSVDEGRLIDILKGLIVDDWDNNKLNFNLVILKEEWSTITVYFQDGREWEALAEDKEGKIYLNIGWGLGFLLD